MDEIERTFLHIGILHDRLAIDGYANEPLSRHIREQIEMLQKRTQELARQERQTREGSDR